MDLSCRQKVESQFFGKLSLGLAKPWRLLCHRKAKELFGLSGVNRNREALDFRICDGGCCALRQGDIVPRAIQIRGILPLYAQSRVVRSNISGEGQTLCPVVSAGRAGVELSPVPPKA